MEKFILTFLIVFLLFPYQSFSAFSKFDLVRNYLAWGSTWTTPYRKISEESVTGLKLQFEGRFGHSVSNIGDLDGDNISDIVVGAPGEKYIRNNVTLMVSVGSIYIFFMNENATVRSFTRISHNMNNGPSLFDGDKFGTSVTSLGDLDGDGILDLAVGSPGINIGSIYILYLHRNGTVREHVLVRGEYISEGGIIKNNNSVPNGPPIKLFDQFGTSVANIGDLNGDGIPDLVCSAVSESYGLSTVYVLFMNASGKVLNYTSISSGIGGGPILAPFSHFGSSLSPIGDLDGDGVLDLAVGAKDLNDGLKQMGGGLYILFLRSDGTARAYQRIGGSTESSSTILFRGKSRGIPSDSFDECGAGVGFIGDINRDQLRQHHPDQLSPSKRPSVGDLIVGCPQTRTTNPQGPGNLFLLFLAPAGTMTDFTRLPGESDLRVDHTLMPSNATSGSRYYPPVFPTLPPHVGFGSSLSGYRDVDGNGIKEIIVGTPFDLREGDVVSTGSVFILFLRRRRWHSIIPQVYSNYLTFWFPLALGCLLALGLIFCIFYYCYRRVDPIELIVKKSGMKISKHRARPKQIFVESKLEKVDFYDE